MPARAAYAAAAAEVLPVEAQIIASEPPSTAYVTAIVMQRSLNEPVGFSPSYFTYRLTSLPNSFGMFSSLMSGVLRSPRLMIRVLSLTGSLSRYFSIRPVYLMMISLFSQVIQRE